MLNADPLDYGRELRRLHDAAFNGTDVSRQLRPMIWESWRRSLEAQVEPDRREPGSTLGETELRRRQAAHPFASLLPMLRESLLGSADESAHVMILTDADGHILWREGSPAVQEDAERVRLTEGVGWSEKSIGTNAMGTALAADTPVRIHSGEHLVRTYHAWTCAASPVHDPETGVLIGSLDISGPLRTMHPALLSLVATSARLVESQLRWRVAARDEALIARYDHELSLFRDEPVALLSHSGRVVSSRPEAWLAVGTHVAVEPAAGVAHLPGGLAARIAPLGDGFLLRLPAETVPPGRMSPLELSVLGEATPSLTLDGHRRELTLRHAEMLVLLAMYPDGLTAERLALLLHGESGNPTTVRVEVHRLRQSLGEDVLRTRPYRLVAEVRSDFGSVRDALRDGRVDDALHYARGSLLPRSESPKIREEREDLTASLRRGVLGSGDPEHLWRYAMTDEGYDDAEVLSVLHRSLPPSSSRSGVVDARLQRLSDED